MNNRYGWDKIKESIDNIDSIYSFDDTKFLLSDGDYYTTLFGRAKNRTLMKDNPKLYKSIYHHSNLLETTMKSHGRYKGWYNFKYRILFIVERNGDIETLRCDCGATYTWNTYCRKCPEYHKTWVGRKHTNETKKKQRTSTLKYLEKTKGQIVPRYNINSISIIEEYGNQHGYNFQHAENGGEYYVKSLGYFLDGYDATNNVVIEIDESHHYDERGNLRESDVIRQNEIEKELNCEFIRIKI